jgi:hypothetical protein
MYIDTSVHMYICTLALDGDNRVAEYLYLSIISNLYNRTESETLLLGNLPIILCGLAVNDPRIIALKEAIATIGEMRVIYCWVGCSVISVSFIILTLFTYTFLAGLY